MNICLQAKSPERWLYGVHVLIWTFQPSPPKQFYTVKKSEKFWRDGCKVIYKGRHEGRHMRDDHFAYFLLQNKEKQFLMCEFALDLFQISKKYEAIFSIIFIRVVTQI